MRKKFPNKDPKAAALKLYQRLRYGPSVVGVDIGASSVNVAQVAVYRGRRLLVETRIVDITPKNGEDHDEATLRALRIALEDFNRKNIKYACVVNCPQTCVRKIITPYMPREDLLGAVSLEVKRSVPFPLSDAVLDFNVIEEVVEKGVDKLSIIVAASPQKTVERILSFFTPKKARPFSGSIRKKFDLSEKPLPLDIRISALLPMPLCLENIIERSRLKAAETLVTIEMGSVVTELNIYKNARLQFSRKIPFSGADITKSLTGALMTDRGKMELSLEEAERIKREYGIPRIEKNQLIDGKITTNQVLSLIRPKVEQLTNEIDRSFNFYREEMRGGKVDRVVLFGGAAQLKGLPEFLGRELGLEVHVGHPLADIDLLSDDVVEREEDAHRLVLAIGAAMSTMKGVNLLPAEKRLAGKGVVTRAVIAGGLAVSVALLAAGGIVMGTKISSLEQKVNAVRGQWDSLDRQLSDLRARVALGQFLSARPFWGDALKEFSHAAPPEMYLERIRMDKGLLFVKGIIETDREPANSVLTRFLVNLEKGLFKNVRLVKTERSPRNELAVKFEIRCGVE